MNRYFTQEEKNSFVDAYVIRLLNPWWASACEQYEAGDATLMEGIKKKAMEETCREFGIVFDEDVGIFVNQLLDSREKSIRNS